MVLIRPILIASVIFLFCHLKTDRDFPIEVKHGAIAIMILLALLYFFFVLL